MKTPREKRNDFEDRFRELVKDHVNTYKGKEPLLSWQSDKDKPLINVDFYYYLPQSVQDALQTIITELEG
jgi:hypothetical protein